MSARRIRSSNGPGGNGAAALGEWAERLGLAGYPVDRGDDGALRSACPFCSEEHRQKWIANGHADTDGMTVIVAAGPSGEVEALCGHCGDETHALWDALEPEAVAPAASNGARPTLRLLDVERMLATEPEPVPFLAEPVLVRGAVTMLAGRESQGKSMLSLALAAALGHGATVAGITCESGQILVVDAENGEREIHRRVRGLGVKPRSLAYVEADGFNLVKQQEDLDRLVERHRPDLLVLDSLRSLAPALEENDSAEVEQVLGPLRALARRHECAVLLIAHAGKAGHEYRGSTALGAGVELGFTLSRDPLDPEGHTRRKLACWKCRPAPEPETRWLALEARDGRVLIGEVEPYDESGSGPSQLEQRAELLGQIVSEHGELAWKDLAERAGLSPTAGATKDARGRAEQNGLIVRTAHGRYGPPDEESGRAGPPARPLTDERSVRPESLGPSDGRTIGEDPSDEPESSP